MLAVVDRSSPLLWACLAFAAAAWFASRLARDPLRKYPGPLLARFTSAYGAYYVWRQRLHLVTPQLHDKYGPVVRLAPNRLVFNNPAAIQEIYNNPRATKGTAYAQLRRDPNGPPTIFTSLNKAEHRAKQRIIGPILNESSLRAFEPELGRQVDAFLRALLRASRRGAAVNASDCCERLGFDIMGQLAFSFAIDSQGDATHRALIAGIKARVNRNAVYFFWPALRVLDGLFSRVAAAPSSVDRFYTSLKTIIAARMQMPAGAKHDFYALASAHMGPRLEPSDLLGEAIFFLAAGGATTATATSGVFFYLSRNPSAYARLAAEIRTSFTCGADIRPGARLTACRYLRAVIDESMRLSPSVLSLMWRQQDPNSSSDESPFVVQGHVIPPGTQVAASAYSMQHSAALFADPHRFAPERWLDADAAEAAAMRRAFAPFSVGERACAGRAMAWAEMRVTVARTLWYFDFARAPGRDGDLGAGSPGAHGGRGRVGEFQLYDGIVVEHAGPNLVFTPRGECWRELEEGHMRAKEKAC